MSRSLYWRPVPREQPDPESATSLKHLLAPRLWGEGAAPGPDSKAILDESDMQYLVGVCDATGSDEMREDAELLIAAIRANGSVELWIEG